MEVRPHRYSWLPTALALLALAGCSASNQLAGNTPVPLPTPAETILAPPTVTALTPTIAEATPDVLTTTHSPVAIAGTRVAPSAAALLAATLRADTALPTTGIQLDRRIVFASQHEGNMELYLVNADGSHLTRLTNTAESEEFPTWSPDGQWIAFQAVSQEGRQSSLVKIRPDNGQLIPLTDGSSIDLIPAWSQDGQRIAFASGAAGHEAIYVIGADGRHPTRLTGDVGADFSAWSPDGQFLAFKGEGGKIVIMRADGSKQVTIPVMASQFAWAPQ